MRWNAVNSFFKSCSRILFIDRNMGDSGAISLSVILTVNSSLTWLNLWSGFFKGFLLFQFLFIIKLYQ